MSSDTRQGLVGAPLTPEDAEADRLQILQDLGDVLVRVESRGHAFQDEPWWSDFCELQKKLQRPHISDPDIPQQGMLGSKEAAELNAHRLREEGCLAWVQAEYGPDHGVQDAYWGHRVWFFSPEQMAKRTSTGGTT